MMPSEDKKPRRIYPEELKREAVQMLEDGHSATSIASRLGLPRTNLIYKWRDRFRARETSKVSETNRSVEELEAELGRVRRERDILKKALSILGRHGATSER